MPEKQHSSLKEAFGRLRWGHARTAAFGLAAAFLGIVGGGMTVMSLVAMLTSSLAVGTGTAAVGVVMFLGGIYMLEKASQSSEKNRAPKQPKTETQKPAQKPPAPVKAPVKTPAPQKPVIHSLDPSRPAFTAAATVPPAKPPVTATPRETVSKETAPAPKKPG